MRLKKWLGGWIIASLVAPLAFLTIYLLFGYTLGEGIVIFWPGSMGLMVLENRPAMTTVVIVWMMSIATNVILYSVVGLLLWPLTLVKSNGPSADKDSQ